VNRQRQKTRADGSANVSSERFLDIRPSARGYVDSRVIGRGGHLGVYVDSQTTVRVEQKSKLQDLQTTNHGTVWIVSYIDSQAIAGDRDASKNTGRDVKSMDMT